MADKDIYAIITCEGHACSPINHDYLSILYHVGSQVAGAGGNDDLPNQLLRNGKVVVEKGLDSIGYRYVTAIAAARKEAEAKVMAEFTPDWLK